MYSDVTYDKKHKAPSVESADETNEEPIILGQSARKSLIEDR